VVLPVAGRLTTVEPATGRVGGLLSPEVVVDTPLRGAVAAVGLAPLPATAPGRRVAVVEVAVGGFFTVLLEAAVAFVPFGAGSAVAELSTLSAGASLCCTTSKLSVSAMTTVARSL
jgi:hypothetical protein